MKTVQMRILLIECCRIFEELIDLEKVIPLINFWEELAMNWFDKSNLYSLYSNFTSNGKIKNFLFLKIYIRQPHIFQKIPIIERKTFHSIIWILFIEYSLYGKVLYNKISRISKKRHSLPISSFRRP
jgi:hypothetical protein